MQGNKWKYSGNNIALIIIVAGILAVINFASYKHFIRWDLTQGKEFTLSEASKKVVAQLNDLVNIKLYFSEKLPPSLLNLKLQIKDLLEEYEVYAKGNLEIEFINPQTNPETENKMRMIGIPKLQLNVIEKDRAQIANVYMGMAIFYEDKKEAIPFVKSVRNLEYEITSRIFKIVRSQVKTIGFLAGYGAHSIDGGYQAIGKFLKKEYEVKEVKITDGKIIPENVDTLVIAGVKEHLAEEAKFAIDQFLMKGGKLIFLIDAVELEGGALSARPLETNLDDLLEQYGIRVRKDLVLDKSNTYATFSSGVHRFMTPYPFWVKVLKANFNQEHSITNRLESMVLPWTSSLELIEGADSSKDVTILARSTPFVQRQEKIFNISPQQKLFLGEKQKEGYPLSVLISGKFKSLFSDRKVPETGSSDGNEKEAIKESQNTQILVVGNSFFLDNGFISQFPGNQIFFLNAIDWLNVGENLIGIRSRRATDRPLQEITEKSKAAIKFIDTFGVAFLIILLGLAYYYRRKKRKIIL